MTEFAGLADALIATHCYPLLLTATVTATHCHSLLLTAKEEEEQEFMNSGTCVCKGLGFYLHGKQKVESILSPFDDGIFTPIPSGSSLAFIMRSASMLYLLGIYLSSWLGVQQHRQLAHQLSPPLRS